MPCGKIIIYILPACPGRTCVKVGGGKSWVTSLLSGSCEGFLSSSAVFLFSGRWKPPACFFLHLNYPVMCSFVSVGHKVPASWTNSLSLIMFLQRFRLAWELVPGCQVFGSARGCSKSRSPWAWLLFVCVIYVKPWAAGGGGGVSFENSILPASHSSTQWKSSCDVLFYLKLRGFFMLN